VASLSQLALRHFQAALYLVLWFRDWDRVQAYVANLAYHLQACLAQHPSLGVHATQVLNWHRLTMAYEDKLAAGRDSAWEYIFFGKFWLDNHEALQPLPRPDPLRVEKTAARAERISKLPRRFTNRATAHDSLSRQEAHQLDLYPFLYNHDQQTSRLDGIVKGCGEGVPRPRQARGGVRPLVHSDWKGSAKLAPDA